MKKLWLLSFLLLAACGDHQFVVTKTVDRVIQPPEGILALCPDEVDEVVPTGPNGRYTEPETAKVAENNRVAYVACRKVVKQDIKDFYANQSKVK